MASTSLVFVSATTVSVKGQIRVSLVEAYTSALIRVGLIPVILPPMAPELVHTAIRGAAGLVLTGGEDIHPKWFGGEPHPAAGEANVARDAYEIALASAAHEQRIPTLALCRGFQIMNIALGGSLIQDIPSERPGIRHPTSSHPAERIHAVDVDARSRLAGILGQQRIVVNSSHHQAIDRVAPSLRVTGTSPDGIVEAIEPVETDWWMIGVQWHPEELMDDAEDWDRRLYEAFADLINSRRGSAHDFGRGAQVPSYHAT